MRSVGADDLGELETIILFALALSTAMGGPARLTVPLRTMAEDGGWRESCAYPKPLLLGAFVIAAVTGLYWARVPVLPCFLVTFISVKAVSLSRG